MLFEERYPTKKYLLDHVLYEMEMYFYTYKALHENPFKDQLLFNTFWSSHNVALRNLMGFFSLGGSPAQDEIRYDFFSFSEKPNGRKRRATYYAAISKAINHITTFRFQGFNGKALDKYVIEAREVLFPEISNYTYTFLNHLEEKCVVYKDGLNMTIDISSEMKDERIRELVRTVYELLFECTAINDITRVWC